MTPQEPEISDEDLLAWLEERLDEATSARLEASLRDSPELRLRVTQLLDQQHISASSPGAVWARYGLSCPDRDSWSSILLNLLDDDEALAYARFHLEVVGCRRCQANVDELQRAIEGDPQKLSRQTRYFESSVGRLRQLPP